MSQICHVHSCCVWSNKHCSSPVHLWQHSHLCSLFIPSQHKSASVVPCDGLTSLVIDGKVWICFVLHLLWFSATASVSWALKVWNCFSFQSELCRCFNSTGWAGEQKSRVPGFDSTWGPLCICSASEDNLTDAAVLMWSLVSCCLAASQLAAWSWRDVNKELSVSSHVSHAKPAQTYRFWPWLRLHH